MFGKVFTSMYEGTLHGHWQAIVTFQQMVVLSEPDGTLDMTLSAISARTSIPLEIFEKGVEILEQPDTYSRSTEFDGRRIVRLDPARPWGWKVVNKAHYRALANAEEKRETDRERIAERRRRELSQPVAECSDTSRDVAESSEQSPMSPMHMQDAYEDIHSRLAANPNFHREVVIAAYHELCPDLPRVRQWTKARARQLSSRITERCKDGKPAETAEYWREFFATVAKSDFLMGRASSFRASLPWLVKAENFAKVIEGNYANRRSNGS